MCKSVKKEIDFLRKLREYDAIETALTQKPRVPMKMKASYIKKKAKKKKPKGLCQGCGKLYVIRADGLVRKHYRGGPGSATCSGSGLKPW